MAMSQSLYTWEAEWGCILKTPNKTMDINRFSCAKSVSHLNVLVKI